MENKITPKKMVAKIKEPLESENISKPSLITDEEIFTTKSESPFLNADRFIFPSRGIFYKKKTLEYSSYTVADLKTIKKFINTDNITFLIDVVQSKVGDHFDVRELTVDDFIALVVQITISSYPEPKYTLTWTSFYGNENKEVFPIFKLQLTEPNLEQLKELTPFTEKYKFTPPKVKFFEVLYNNGFKKHKKTNSWDEEQTWLYEEIGQYYDFDSVEKQCKHAGQIATKSEEFEKLKEFKKACAHGLITTYDVKDAKFDPQQALDFLRTKERALKASVENFINKGSSLEEISEVFDLVRISREIERIELHLQEGKSMGPVTEKLELPVDLPSLMQPLFD